MLLGGDFEPHARGAEAAYVLSCASRDEALGLVTEDPFVSSGRMRAEVVEWQVVGVSPDAVEPKLRQRRDDVDR